MARTRVRSRVRWGRVGALVASASLAAAIAVGQAGATGFVAHRVHAVQAGETLWSIARDLVGPQGDPRPVVEELIAANGLHGPRILPGQRLSLPAPP